MKRSLIFAICWLPIAVFAQTTQTGSDYIGKRVQLTLSNAPQPVPNASVFVSGNPGPATYYYWIVTQNGLGASSPAGPFQVINAPNTLSVSNFNQISWATVAGATYDVLRTTNTGPPSGACNCAVATAVAGNSVSDQSNTLGAYTVNTLDPSTKTVTLQNTNGVFAVSSPLAFQTFWKTCDASFYAGVDDGAKIQAADLDPNCDIISAVNLVALTGANPVTIHNGKHLILPCGLYVGSTTSFIIGSFASLRGRAQNCTIVSTNSATANIIDIPNATQWWGVYDLAIRSEVARTAGAGLGIHGGNGVAERVVVYPVFDGAWADTASTAGLNVLREVQFTNGTGTPTAGNGGAWHCGFRNGGVATGTVSGNTLDHVTVSMITAFTDAGICIQDGSDTIIIDDNTQAVANIGGSDSRALHLETVNGGNAPANIQVSDSTFEGGVTKEGVVIDSGLNAMFSNVTVQSSLRGVLLNSCIGCSFKGGTFHLNQQEGFRLVNAFNTLIEGNRFSANSQQTTNTFDDIFVAANNTVFQIRNNTHADFFSTGKICKWGVEVAAGTSNNYAIADINPGSCGTGSVSDSGTGTNKYVCNPGAACNFGNSAIQQMGATSGTVTVQPAAVAGTPTLTWPTASGVIGASGTGTTTTNGTAIAAGTCQAQSSITIAAALTSDSAVANINAAIPATWQTGISWRAEVQSAGACVPILCNPTAGSITPAATAIRCTTTHTQ